MLFYLSLLPALAVGAVFSRSTSASFDLEEVFGSELSSEAEIFYPSWSNWTDNVQQRWTDYQAPTYLGAIKVATVADIQSTVKLANSHNVSFLATAGGHGIASTFAKAQNVIDIDLSNFRYINIDKSGDSATIGGATTFGQMWEVLYENGKELQTGTAECVGSVGATLGAGIGPLQGHRGLVVDALQSVKLVTATGDLVTASKTENSDLFWGMRGAGWNFGIVVEATYEIYDYTNNGMVLEGDMLFPASANQSVWELLKGFDDDLPAKLAMTFTLSYNSEANATNIMVTFTYYGERSDIESYIKPFQDLEPTKSNFTSVPLPKLYSALFFANTGVACTKNNHLFSGGAAVREIDVDTFVEYTNRFASFWPQYPGVSPALVISRFPNDAVVAVPDDETAYPYRDIKTHLYFEETFPDDTSMNSVVYDFLVESRDHFTKTSGYDSLTLYNNYAHGDEGPEVLYTAKKLPRLSQLKRKWDPNERFSFYNPVPLNYP
ncbi:hypothetical protein BDV25DRAFT_162207 [Aspergillus avenaceus]|uniref:FAD-binding PCMH-type domain-containing protein n=1 Tax=Aspergillus avenaceus TaxID=36643 RepID=A0A5N6TJN1_ASPAV|nr:hypothetical protein BDV25DRAFT_162207 [Aspergillus avenaceus]